MFSKVLIANRGAIACRILRTLKKMGIASVTVYSEADADSRHVLDADESFCIGPAQATKSYLNIESILKVAKESGAQAIHPGYGFLSESIDFARACAEQGIVFIGPGIDQIEAFALKHTARSIALQCGVPLLPGTGLLADKSEATQSALQLTYPVMLKSSAGGGGIGMKVCSSPQELEAAYDSVVRMGQSSFGNGSVYLEKFIPKAKHIEVQIFGDGSGEILVLGARDCSAQRRHQKVIEETPVPGLSPDTEQKLFASARLLGNAVGYSSAGTVEFLFDVDQNAFYFLEVNTRLQVEHGVTEQVTGLDLVQMMIHQAAGELPSMREMRITPKGASIEARVYAEDPARGFQPAPGKLSGVVFPDPELARIETWVEDGTEVTPYYDPMIAKIIVTGKDRADAVAKMTAALQSSSIYGTETNLRYLRSVVASKTFADGEITTAFLATMPFVRQAFEVLESGTQTTIQDYPGRLGYWHVGVPPSGPMDPLSFRLANRLAGNADGEPALEMTGIGAKLRFDADTTIAITGADMGATLDGVSVERWQSLPVKAGQILRFGPIADAGSRTYLAVSGGLDVPRYLGSKSTFMLGRFGGHAGRALRAGDIVHYGDNAHPATIHKLPDTAIPLHSHHWTIAVLYGPHGSPEFFTQADIEMIFSTDWRVHYQSARTGIRLVGPRPEWARKDGGEAGLHPSNIHDNAYAIGSIDFTGDMPILLGPDGPSLGGFVCPAVVASAELWKLGQLKAGDTVRFQRVSEEDARALESANEAVIEQLSGTLAAMPVAPNAEPAVLRSSENRKPGTTYRADGDKYLLVEYGEKILDLGLRFRVHLLEQKLSSLKLSGLIDVTPGVRSLQVHYDSRILSRDALLETLDAIDKDLPENPDITVPSRIVHMPLSWNDPATQLAQSKYMHSVRPDAPWCPDNIEFIRRINGLDSIEDVYRIVHAASYLVLGLGDVYLGAPVATPTDPRHRLVTTKYNPARTWTPENAVGIGGAYMCIYGMEGPGGYQLVGRTVQVWNTHRSTKTFAKGTPWSLRFFDQIRFYPVSSEELLGLRSQIIHGRFDPQTEEGSFNLLQYQDFLKTIAVDAEAFRTKQQQAFREERERWRINGLLEVSAPPDDAEPEQAFAQIAEGCEAVSSPMTASVFQIAVEVGQRVTAGAKLIVLDAMKTEIVIAASSAGVVEEIRCAAGKLVQAGQTLVVLRVG
jgi:urea carboxylase